MLTIASHALLSCALVAAPPTTAGPLSYPAAAKIAEAKQQPLLVLVGATWCPGCQTMERSVLPTLARKGALGQVSYAAVDVDREPQLAGSLMRTSAIPQLIIFSKQPDGAWHREQIIGEATEQEVQSLIVRAQQAQTLQPAAAGTSTTSSGAIGN